MAFPLSQELFKDLETLALPCMHFRQWLPLACQATSELPSSFSWVGIAPAINNTCESVSKFLPSIR